MEELIELRKSITSGNYAKALELVDEIEAMSKEDKLDKIYSYAVILLLHLIKQEAEQRTTKSWNVSIKNSAERINRTNKRRNAVLGVSPMSDCVKTRRKSGGYYAKKSELQEIINDAIAPALRNASLEAFEGTYSEEELLAIIDLDSIMTKTLKMLEY